MKDTGFHNSVKCGLLLLVFIKHDTDLIMQVHLHYTKIHTLCGLFTFYDSRNFCSSENSQGLFMSDSASIID